MTQSTLAVNGKNKTENLRSSFANQLCRMCTLATTAERIAKEFFAVPNAAKTMSSAKGLEMETNAEEYLRQAQIDANNAHPLQKVFADVLRQVTDGKGNERHGNGKNFMAQPWVQIADIHGLGFLTGQASKKLDEAQQMVGERWEREMFGVIAYAAMAILHHRKQNGN